MYVGLRVKYTLLLSDFNKTFCRQNFEKSSNIIFHENPSRVSRVVPCGQTERRIARHDNVDNRFIKFCERA